MSTVIPTQMEKCKGAMLCTAIGDALGWPNEPRSKNKVKYPRVVDHFVGWTRRVSKPRWHDESILPGEYSDDTQLTLSVARSIIAGDWEKFFAEKELPFWLNYERGGGSSLLKAANSCKKGKLLWQSKYTKDYFNAGGNGAVMRILPHVISSANTVDISDLMVDIAKNTLITHGHPRAFLGATCYAYALNYLLRKETTLEYGELVTAVIDGEKEWGACLKADIFNEWLKVAQHHLDYNFTTEWENTRVHMIEQLEFIRESLKKGIMLDDKKVLAALECFGKINGAGDVTILAAIYLASKYANNPFLGIKIPAFSFGADTDTLASITGGLLGMLNGVEWIPKEWKSVQDYDCIIQMTELLLANNKKEAVEEEVAEVTAQELQWKNTAIGKIILIGSNKVPNGNYGIVVIEKWRNRLGQTLYTKMFQAYEIQSQIYPPEAPKEASEQSIIYDAEPGWQNQLSSSIVKNSQIIKPEQQIVAVGNNSQQFILSIVDIDELLSDSKFKKNITIGKVLKIVRSLFNSNSSTSMIAKQFNVDQAFVEQIKKYILKNSIT